MRAITDQELLAKTGSNLKLMESLSANFILKQPNSTQNTPAVQRQRENIEY